ncbi:hypothetical protein [Chryseobacterium sp. RU33C]|nr:hypothetical protein [Chryseobacterium sp. RU33C]
MSVVPIFALNVVLKPEAFVMVNFVTPPDFPVMISVPDEVD